jgi:ATP-dependent exoDNAse (exonuclease V) beta subunit
MQNNQTNNFVVYRSSAGSGKTFTLVKEFIKLLVTSNSSDYFKHILAITFTNKASAEMKDRILEALKEFSSNNIMSDKAFSLLTKIEEETGLPQALIKEKSKVILKTILHQYSDFSISTIDKFTHRIVRTFARDLHLPLNFEVYLDKDDILEQAVDLLIDQIGENLHITKTLTEFAYSKIEEEKQWSPRNSVFSFAKQLFYNEGSEKIVDALKNIDITHFEKLNKNLNENVTEFEKFIKSKAKEAFEIINNTGFDYSFFAGGDSKGITKYFSYIIACKIDKLSPSKSIIKFFEQEKLYSGVADKKAQEIIKSITPQLSLIFNELSTYIDNNFSNYYLSYSAQKNLYALSLITYIDKFINQLQGENNLLLLANFNKLINDIVVTEPVPFIYERIGEKFRNLMIDEFQDTSVLQWQNLLPLVENSLASGNFNMLVGDAKQSIYRWRGGVSEQFINLPKIYQLNSPELILEKENTLINNYSNKKLGSNFRSYKEIVEFNNSFFSVLADTVSECKELYKDVVQEFNPEKSGGYIQINLFDSKTKIADNEYFLKLDNILEELLADGYKYKDIAVITAKNIEGNAVAQHLTQKNISIISPENLNIHSSVAVQLLIATLKLLTLPYDTSARVLFIKSYLIYTNKTENLTSLTFECKEANISINNFIKKIIGTKIEVEDILALSMPEQCEYIINNILKINSHDAYMLCFIDVANDFSKRTIGGDLVSFLDWWNEYSEKISVKMPEDIDAVNILTIHKSKGLEFPVVIYFFANKIERKQKEFFWLENALEKENSISHLLVKSNVMLENTTLKTAYELEKMHSKQDLINEMYVAFTRPINRLYILCNRKEQNNNTPLSLGNTYSVNQFVLLYLAKMNLLKNNIDTYSFGISIPFVPENKKKSDIIHEELNFVKSISWRDKIKISQIAPPQWNAFDNFDVRAYGIYIHRILQHATSINDIKCAENTGNFTTELHNEIIKTALLLWERAAIDKYLFDGYTALSEIPILSNKKIFIPDKVLVKNLNVVILDFKTGEKNENYFTQLKNYTKLYIEMGYSVEKAFIVYTDEIIELVA